MEIVFLLGLVDASGEAGASTSRLGLQPTYRPGESLAGKNLRRV